MEICVNEFAVEEAARHQELLCELEELKGTLRNERIWANGYGYDEPYNPHLENICILMDQIEEVERELYGN